MWPWDVAVKRLAPWARTELSQWSQTEASSYYKKWLPCPSLRACSSWGWAFIDKLRMQLLDKKSVQGLWLIALDQITMGKFKGMNPKRIINWICSFLSHCLTGPRLSCFDLLSPLSGTLFAPKKIKRPKTAGQSWPTAGRHSGAFSS